MGNGVYRYCVPTKENKEELYEQGHLALKAKTPRGVRTKINHNKVGKLFNLFPEFIYPVKS
jgi:hypothetical protein